MKKLSKLARQRAEKLRKFEIQPLLSAHQIWVSMIKKYAKGKSSAPLCCDTVLKCGSSKLGNWISNEGRELFGETEEWQVLKNLHCNLHHTAAEIIKFRDMGQNEMAISILEGPFKDLSKQVKSAVKALDDAYSETE